MAAKLSQIPRAWQGDERGCYFISLQNNNGPASRQAIVRPIEGEQWCLPEKGEKLLIEKLARDPDSNVTVLIKKDGEYDNEFFLINYEEPSQPIDPSTYSQLGQASLSTLTDVNY